MSGGMSERSILLVEDNADDAELTMHAFSKHQLANRVVHVADGAAALEYMFGTGAHAGRDAGNPTFELLDLKLPKVPGLEVLRQLRAEPRTRRVPIVVLTSSDEERDMIESYDLGANSFVRKPVDFAEFVEAAGHLAKYWLVLNQQPEPVG